MKDRKPITWKLSYLLKFAVAMVVSRSNRVEEHAVTQVSSAIMQRNLVEGKCHEQS